MASPQVAPNRNHDFSPARVHIWRVLSLLSGLIAVIVALVLIATSAA